MSYDIAMASLVGGLTGIISLLILDRNWYRRENFKVGRDLTKSKNQLEIQKMRRDLGLDKKSNPIAPLASPPTGGIDMLRSLAPLLQSLAPEQIQDLIEGVTGVATPEGSEGGIGGLDGIDGLIDFATKNPEIVKSFLGGVKGGSQKEGELPSQV